MPKVAMASEATCVIVEIQGHHSRTRRVALVQMEGNKRINALQIFQGLGKKEERTLRTRFDYWIDGAPGTPIYKKYVHKWDKKQYGGQYEKCFVFKLGDRRFYGYLCNPDPNNRRLEFCILILHVFKDGWRTEESDLRFVKDMGEHQCVSKALADLFSKG